MQQFLLIFYVLFFATGFMGAAALFLLGLRIRSSLIRLLLLFQVLFLFGLGLGVVYYYLQTLPVGIHPALRSPIIGLSSLVNASLYGVAIFMIRHISPPEGRKDRGFPLVAQLFSGLVLVKSLINIAGVAVLGQSNLWNLSGYLLSGLAIGAFGLVARGPFTSKEPPVVKSLLRAYGTCALVFAPLGFVEFAVQIAEIPWLDTLSLDHFFFLSWNIVSMSVAIRLFAPNPLGVPIFESVPDERITALGLSEREVEMAVLIARGLANKEIATKLGISPATVRTHIYNLYQKVGASSRVELLNMLRKGR